MSGWASDVLRAGSAMFGGAVTIPGWLAATAALLAVATTVAAGWAVSRSAAVKESLATIIEANEELRRANADLRAEVQAEKERRAQLEGRLDVLVSGLAERIISATADAWQRAHGTNAAREGLSSGGTQL